MPYLRKSTISRYFRTLCKRQLRLNLTPVSKAYEQERIKEGMPKEQPPRPGLQNIVMAGIDWEIEKYRDLEIAFTASNIIGKSSTDTQGRTVYGHESLLNLISNTPNKFIIQGEYNIRNNSSFENALNINDLRKSYNMDYAKLRPDIIQTLHPMTYEYYITPDGREELLSSDDTRIQLRVIDVKLTAEPSAGYFAEIAYYMMTLAGWLQDEGLDKDYVVVSGAVWPGSHDSSILYQSYQESINNHTTLTTDELNDCLNQDLESVPFSVFSIRLRRFLQDELKEVLNQNWSSIPFHVSKICKGCDYLGYPWKDKNGNFTYDKDHCMQIALQQGHLSQIANISQGATNALRDNGVHDINALSTVVHQSHILDSHQALKAKRSILPVRAKALQQRVYLVPQNAGTSSVMPKWSDLSIYVSVDFDISSGITSAFGLKAFWIEPKAFDAPQNSNRKILSWPDKKNERAFAYIVDNRDLNAERRELIAFLRQIREILNEAEQENKKTTMQVYIWDELEIKHLKRVIGRHLPFILSDPSISELTWLFPPETILPNSGLQRRSPITTIKETINSVAALPIAHYYSLLATVRAYHRNGTKPDWFSVHPLFEDELSDQIPSERIHDIWSRSTNPNRHWAQQLQTFRETVGKRISALEEVTRKLQEDLRPSLQEKAPHINISSPNVQGKMSFDGELLFAHAKLDAKMRETEVLAIRAMPIHEREAKFNSARLTNRLSGALEKQVLQSFGLGYQLGRRVYELGSHSRSVKMKEGDFSFALSPNEDASFLNMNLWYFTKNVHDLNQQVQNLKGGSQLLLEDVLNVSIAAMDVDRGYIVIDSNLRYGIDFIEEFERNGLANFQLNVSIDPISKDYFTKKLKECLQNIGNPAIASRDQAVIEAMGLTGRRGARRSDHTPAADFLWNVKAMSSTPAQCPKEAPFGKVGSPSLDDVKKELEKQDLMLTPTQWRAWKGALEKRLQIIWGPPGTGKSRTLRSIIVGAFESAKRAQAPLRVLVCASTYTAVDNVLIDAYQHIIDNYPIGYVEAARLRSEFSNKPSPTQSQLASQIDVEVNWFNPSQFVKSLCDRLISKKGLTLVGSTPEQIYNLLKSAGSTQAELFDLILIDEASQMDVAHCILPLCSLASGANLVLAGDPKQLPPIHQVEPPLGLEEKVGSIYDYMSFLGADHVMLDRNYRSNEVIVNFALEAGYERSLMSHSPDLKLRLASALSSSKPDDWPKDLYWSTIWDEMVDPDKSVVCFVYPDGKSSQWNDFEVDAVASLIKTLYGRVANQLENEFDAKGILKPSVNTPYMLYLAMKKCIKRQLKMLARQHRSFCSVIYLF